MDLSRSVSLAMVCGACLVACGSDDTQDPAAAGGSGAVSSEGGSGGAPSSSGGGSAGTPSGGGGTEVGGAAGSGASGGTSTGTSGSAGAGTGGSEAAGSGGTGGASGAGTGGSGTAGSGGTGGDPTCRVGVHDPGNPPQALTLTGATIHSHDPVIIEAHGSFYSYSTGDNLVAKTSADLLDWQWAPEVFDGSPARPAWLQQNVPGVSNLWAPDISSFGGNYHLYYSASTFGSNQSCIGHLTRPALDTGDFVNAADPVICSNVGTNDNWNAIDPNVVVDQGGTPWLSFGSFWSGIKLIELDQSGAQVGSTVHSIAARPGAGGALEAPFIVWRCGYYYLFVSWDSCCNGVDSTYNIRVGRSATVTGPYEDRSGTAMLDGGGTLVLEADQRWRGPGHNAILISGTDAYNIYHAYDANDNGTPTLRISELVWDADGWPISGGP